MTRDILALACEVTNELSVFIFYKRMSEAKEKARSQVLIFWREDFLIASPIIFSKTIDLTEILTKYFYFLKN